MRAMLLMTLLGSVNLLAASEEMNVAICNPAGISETVVSQAKAEAEAVYRSAGVRIVWRDSAEFSIAASREGAPWFFIRLRNDNLPRSLGPASLDVMGRAFAEDHGGYMADVYFQAVQATSKLYLYGDTGVLLGFVIAHELGHLLLGPGHSLAGVMQAAWGLKQMCDMRQRRFKFPWDSARRIRQALDARTVYVR